MIINSTAAICDGQLKSFVNHIIPHILWEVVNISIGGVYGFVVFFFINFLTHKLNILSDSTKYDKANITFTMNWLWPILLSEFRPQLIWILFWKLDSLLVFTKRINLAIWVNITADTKIWRKAKVKSAFFFYLMLNPIREISNILLIIEWFFAYDSERRMSTWWNSVSYIS